MFVYESVLSVNYYWVLWKFIKKICLFFTGKQDFVHFLTALVSVQPKIRQSLNVWIASNE